MSIFGKLFLVVALFVGGGNAVWAQKSLPYSYGFENNSLAKEGWTTNNIYSGYTGILNSIMNNGSYCFRFYASSTYTPQYLISPELASSATGIDVSFYYRSLGGNYTTKFSVGYSTTGTNISDFTWSDEVSYAGGYTSYTYSFATGIKYIAIKYTATDTSCHLYIDDFSVSAINPYKVPTAFTLESVAKTSATFSWTAGNSETAWQFAYSTDSDFTPGTDGTTLNITTSDLSSGKYILSGLTEGTTYYASIRANYGDGNYSEWTDKISFTPNDEIELLLYDGTTSSYNFPISSANVANTTALTQTQFIIPSSDLTSIKNRQITKLTFYASRNSVTWGAATFEVYMKETSNTSYSTSSKSFESWGTCVYNNQGLSTNSSNGQMEITLNTPFNYTSGNLMIGFKQQTKGTAPFSTYWYSTQPYSNNAIYSYGTSVVVASYSPKVTMLTVASSTAPVKIDDNGYTTFASVYPLDLTDLPTGLKAYKAAVNGEKVNFTEINQTVSANTGILLEGTAGETYFIPVAESGTAPEGNEFFVNSTGGTFSAESGYTYFGLLKNSNPLTFGVFYPASVAIPTNKAYLKVAGVKGARVLSCSFSDGDIQGIEDNVTEHDNQLSGSTIFNLAGQKVENPTKGLYIINGRKQVIK